MSQKSSEDLHFRILAMLDGTLDQNEAARLDAELCESREARALYQKLALLHVALEEQAAAYSGLKQVPVVPIERLLARQRRRLLKTSFLAAAAVILVSLVGFWMKTVRNTDSVARFRVGPDTAFTLTHTGEGDTPSGKVLAPGSELRLTRGTMEAVFRSGVRCVIEAPCDLTVLSDDRISMAEGTAWFEVPQAAVGFTVETPELTVTDLGTEFGVVARARQSHEVHVIKGSVEVSSNSGEGEDAKLVLSGGQASRVDREGGFISIPVQGNRFTAALPRAVFIANHSFEADRNLHPRGYYNDGPRLNHSHRELTGWSHLAEANTGGSAGSGVMVGWAATEPSSLHPFPPVPDQPSQALSLRSVASVLNRTGTRWASLDPGDKLTLTIALGEMASQSLNWNEQTFFGLTDDAADLSSVEPSDTVANSGIIRNNPATGTQSGNGRLSDVTLVHTVTEADLKRPGRIGILIFSSGVGGGETVYNQAKFDNVRLQISARPRAPDPDE